MSETVAMALVKETARFYVYEAVGDADEAALPFPLYVRKGALGDTAPARVTVAVSAHEDPEVASFVREAEALEREMRREERQ